MFQVWKWRTWLGNGEIHQEWTKMNINQSIGISTGIYIYILIVEVLAGTQWDINNSPIHIYASSHGSYSLRITKTIKHKQRSKRSSIPMNFLNVFHHVSILFLVVSNAVSTVSKWSKSVGMMKFPIYGEFQHVPNSSSFPKRIFQIDSTVLAGWPVDGAVGAAFAPWPGPTSAVQAAPKDLTRFRDGFEIFQKMGVEDHTGNFNLIFSPERCWDMEMGSKSLVGSGGAVGS